MSGCAGVFASCKDTFSKKEVDCCNKILEMVKKVDKLDFKLRKAKLDINFLRKFENNNNIPNFLCF